MDSPRPSPPPSGRRTSRRRWLSLISLTSSAFMRILLFETTAEPSQRGGNRVDRLDPGDSLRAVRQGTGHVFVQGGAGGFDVRQAPRHHDGGIALREGFEFRASDGTSRHLLPITLGGAYPG